MGINTRFKNKKTNEVGRKFSVALVGNPNVGKSTLFNTLTGMNQHTGNWAGKTVECAKGSYSYRGYEIELVDLPGTYSLYTHSSEEEVTRDYICRGAADLVLIVCDSSCPDRSLNLAIQVLSVVENAVICFNLADEAERRGVKIDTDECTRLLGTPACMVTAKRKKSLNGLKELIHRALCDSSERKVGSGIEYPQDVLSVLKELSAELFTDRQSIGERELFLTAMLLSAEGDLTDTLSNIDSGRLSPIYIERVLTDKGIDQAQLCDAVAEATVERAQKITASAVRRSCCGKEGMPGGWLDRLLTGRYTAYPIMVLLLFGVLYLTVAFANYPSEALSWLFGLFGGLIYDWMVAIGAPDMLIGALYDGVYTVLTEVVSVMLPPMAIFFPLFTLLEDAGFLPRFAYNLDAPFRCVGACGKQSLTMCMGLGCNAAGVVGCRIIDSARERRLAIVTNSLVPCNGRFPTILLVSGMFLAADGIWGSALTALSLVGVIMLGIGATFLCTLILSRVVWPGKKSFFTIEMPPFRRPDILRVLVRSFLDRTLSVLYRAIAVAAPAGLIIWALATVRIGDATLLSSVVAFLDPMGRLLGFDGVMLAAFILGFPAAEIVMPIAVIGYIGVGIGEAMHLEDISSVLTGAGWTPLTAVSVILFSLMHWPCSTTLITVYKETGSIKTTAVAALAPTLLGATVCILLNLFF